MFIKWIKQFFAALQKTTRIDEPRLSVSIPLPSFSKRIEVETNFNIKKGGFKPQFIIIHHSATADSGTKNWDAICKFHTEVRGWNSVGYNFGMENVDGKIMIFEGRQIGEVGAHALGFNAKSVGICLVGNYDNESPSEEKLQALSLLCRNLQREFSIPRENVIGHRETYVKLGKPVEKSCPGGLFSMDDFRKRLIDS